jgi:hypothetical protein
MDAGVVGAMIPIVAILGGLGFAAYGMTMRIRVREMLHRERLAMIEKGMTPPPEPIGDRWEHRRGRSRGFGVLLICIGIGLALLIPARGPAIGAFVALIGLASLINSAMDRRAAGPGPESLPPGEPRPPMTN